MDKNSKDVIIIGGGPAGLSAAIYLKRYGLDVLLLEKIAIGGEVFTTVKVDNYLGFFDITGFELSNQFKKHLNYEEVPFKIEEVISIQKDNEEFRVNTNKNIYYAKKILITSGRRHKTLNIPSEEKFINKGISFCAACDAVMMKDKTIAVVGAGNSAFEELPLLATHAKKVYLFVRSKIRADKVLVDKVKEFNNIEIHMNEEIEEYMGEDYINSIRTNKGIYDVSAVFLYVGLTPNLSFLSNLDLEVNDNHLVINNKFETNIKGIYAAGDVTKKDLYQIVTSAGEGAEAAYHIYKELR